MAADGSSGLLREVRRGSGMGCLAAVAPIPPTSNRGGKSLSEHDASVCIDFCSFTFSEHHLGEGREDRAWMLDQFAQGDDGVQHELVSALLASVSGGAPLVVGRERRGFLHFYDHHFPIFGPDGGRCGFVAFGGDSQRHSVNVQLTGAACAHVKAWSHVASRLSSINARLTRVDVAFDDLKGSHDLREVVAMHAAGKFTTNGRPPSMQKQGWNDGSGRTIYIGKDRSHQQLCVYEKGREQGARDGDEASSWVRWEARFGAAYRVIPLDILMRPAAYMRGQYPALYFVRAIAERAGEYLAKASANFASARRHARQQCGRFLHALRETFGEQGFTDFVLRELVVSRLPDWFRFNAAAPPIVAAAA